MPTFSDALRLHATAFLGTPNEYDFYGIGGITYDATAKQWTGITEGMRGAGTSLILEVPRLYEFQVNWAEVGDDYAALDDVFDVEGAGSIDVISSHDVDPGVGLKGEGLARVPHSLTSCAASVPAEGEATATEYWLVSESNSNTATTNPFFSKRFGHPDINTYSPGSLRPSRLLRTTPNGTVLEDVALPEWLYWDGEFDWDYTMCYGTRPLKGLHSLTVLEPASDGSNEQQQLIMTNQISLYQDGPEPTIFEGSDVRIMVWNISQATDDSDKDSTGCSMPSLEYSHSFRYETSRLQIETFQKGASHLRAVFGILAISPTEFIVTESEEIDGFGISSFISDLFYVKIDSPSDTVDHCESLLDCDGVEVPVKRHLLQLKTNPYEVSDIAWGPNVEMEDGTIMPTIAIAFEKDYEVGIYMEQYIFNRTALEGAPVWENNQDSTVFVQRRVSVLAAACVLFGLGIILQSWWLRRDQKKQRAELRRQGGEIDLSPGASSHQRGYKDYVLVSAVVNSCLLGGVVFGFPGLVLILRREGVFADVCSCGYFCAGQKEQLSVVSTIGFACAISSRLVAGIFLDKFGPKITAICSGLISTAGLILLATAEDTAALTDRITAAWIILAVGGSSMHLTSFHVTNLQPDLPKKRKASLYVSAGFGAGSLVLPVLQVIHQYGNVKLQTICAVYASIAVLLTVNSIFVQPWRAFNSVSSEATLDLNCFRKSWWPSSIHELTAIKRKQDAKYPPLRDALKSFVFWGETFWFTTQLFLLTYYLSTINQIMFALGDAAVSSDVDSLLNNMFTRACVFFNGLGWLWSPSVGHIMKTRSIYFRIRLELVMALAMALMLAVPVLEVSAIVMLLQALVRLQVFSNHFAYIGERFGFRHFGLLNGVSSLVAGAFGLLGYLLQTWALFVANGNYGYSYLIVAGIVASGIIFPIRLRMIDQKAAAEAEREAERQGQSGETESIESVGKTLDVLRLGDAVATEGVDMDCEEEGVDAPDEDQVLTKP